jgi:hypothetical protein
VNLVTTLTGLLGSACGPNYLNQFNINANLVNTGAVVLGNPEFQVVELQQANGTPPPNPCRFKMADDVVFQIDLPGPIQRCRFRFFVNVFAMVGDVSEHVPDGGKGLKRERLGQLAIEWKAAVGNTVCAGAETDPAMDWRWRAGGEGGAGAVPGDSRTPVADWRADLPARIRRWKLCLPERSVPVSGPRRWGSLSAAVSRRNISC